MNRRRRDLFGRCLSNARAAFCRDRRCRRHRAQLRKSSTSLPSNCAKSWMPLSDSSCERWVVLRPKPIRQLRSMPKRHRFNSAGQKAQRPVVVSLPAGRNAPEVEWKAQSVMRYHGRLADLASRRAARTVKEEQLVLFVMPSLGVAERVAEILASMRCNARLALAEDTSDSAAARRQS